jgi:GNAT superfamily N-acetyltransferase
MVMIKLKQLLLCEEIDENDFIINSQRQSVSVSIMGQSVASVSRRPSTVGIDNVENHTWWISRVLVGDPNDRRKGIGSILLQRAIKEVLKRDPKANIIVEPGGYDLKTEDQIRFYKKNGFVDVPNKKGVLIYGGNQ